MAGDVRELWIKTELLILALCEKLRRLAFPYKTFYSLSYMKDFSCFFCANCYLFSGEKRMNSTILNSTHSENSYQFSSQLFISAGINTEQESLPKRNSDFFTAPTSVKLKTFKRKRKLGWSLECSLFLPFLCKIWRNLHVMVDFKLLQNLPEVSPFCWSSENRNFYDLLCFAYP